MPQELNRKFAQIRELDERTHLLEKTVDADTIAQLRQASREWQGAVSELLVCAALRHLPWWARTSVALRSTELGGAPSLRCHATGEVSSPAKRQRTSAADELSSEVAERLERNMNELIKLSDEKVGTLLRLRLGWEPGRQQRCSAKCPARRSLAASQ